MRNVLVIALFLLLALAGAVAQQNPTAPGVPPGSTPPQGAAEDPTLPPSSSGQETSPRGQMPGAEGEIIEGCLGGSDPNFTITDKAGTTYKLGIPQGANASVLSKHIGESVQVLGVVDGAGASGSTPSGSTPSASGGASAGGQRTIQVSKIGKGQGTCPAGAGAGAAAEKPPAK